MSNKKPRIYVCSECGYSFPHELSHLIESKVQVYCEKCGTPFSIEGVKFKDSKEYPLIAKRPSRQTLSEKSESSFNDVIQFFNKVSFIPILIFSLVTLFLIPPAIIMGMMDPTKGGEALNRLLLGISGLFIAIYDIKYISPRIRDKRYNEIWIHSLAWGILGCIIFGTGTIILVKGILVLIYVPMAKDNKELKAYDFGLLIKNSLNNFSALAGIIIILMSFWSVASGVTIITDFTTVTNPEYQIPIDMFTFILFFIMSLTAIVIDAFLSKNLKIKERFEVGDFILFLVLGIVGVMFYAAGIFILLKAATIFFLLFGKPTAHKPQAITQLQTPQPSIPQHLPSQGPYQQPRRRIEPIKPQPPERRIEPIKPVESVKDIDLTKKEKKDVIKHIKKTEKLKEELVKEPTPEKVVELKLHESLLPVKDEKDKELVKQYFTKIFTVLSKETREKIKDLKIPKKARKELLQELAFVSAEKQIEYADAIIQLYQELPKELIKRIHKLPNVKPDHYGKIIEQLKYMDADEQVRFIQFLENNA